MKRIISIILIMVMLSSLCGFASDYSDSWAAAEIKELTTQDLFQVMTAVM